MDYFVNSLQHLFAELERIDLLIAAQVSRARQRQSEDDQFQGLYISEEEVNALLNQPNGLPRWARESSRHHQLRVQLESLAQHIRARAEESVRRGIELRLLRLQELFALDQLAIDILLVCVAGEVDLRYERLYAYLHDDVTKKRPSVDLALGLLAQTIEMRFTARNYFTADAPLLCHRLLECLDDPGQPHPPLLAKALKVDDRIARYVLGSDAVDDRLHGTVTVCNPKATADALLVHTDVSSQLLRFVRENAPGNGTIVSLLGLSGVGKQSTAEAVCRGQGLRLLVVDLEQLHPTSDTASSNKLLRLVQREAKLQAAAVYWKGFDTILQDDKKSLLLSFLDALRFRPALTFLAGEKLWEPTDALRGAPFARVELRRPNFAERSRIWSAALNGSHVLNDDVDLAALATKFKFTGGQILDVAATAENLARLRDTERACITSVDLHEASRLHSNQRLVTLARKITPKYQWQDIVLPTDRFEQLHEICNHVKYRDRVYGEWGFDRKLAMGKGLCVLFAGPSGTGKTMAAEILAKELGLDLYKIDVATVVSKYIGETEKNLARVFAEAEASNAILFFDEADAIFGKRSEVKDAHDRYANIEIGYLLQRMEEYEGIVILATNFRKNMDEAFVRRLHFAIDFPFPNEEDRLRIWQQVWPKDTPRDPALDLSLLAQRFQITGGNIRNIALAAAFLAIDDSEIVSMPHIVRATQREYQKMGKVISAAEFGLPGSGILVRQGNGCPTFPQHSRETETQATTRL